MGIPHIMSANLDQPWWQPAGTPFDPNPQIPRSKQPQYGITGQQLDTQLQAWVKQHVHLNAYQAFAKMTKQDQVPNYE
eukprot:1424986-Karenia_brevis.AAC.1